MTGHLLGPARHWAGVYRAVCQCGRSVYGRTLPAVWEAHQKHLDATRAACQQRHGEVVACVDVPDILRALDGATDE